MSGLMDFLQFRLLIAEDVLKVFYLMCAICIPVAAWYFLLWVIRRYAIFMELYKDAQPSLLFMIFIWIVRKIGFFRKAVQQQITWQTLTPTQKLKFLGLYVLMVGFAELFLRLMFEYLIAYIHMHEWLKPVAAT